jgi:hypothetical protein
MVLAHRRRHLFLGEPYAQLRKVGSPIYISHPDLVQSPTMRETDPPTISQSASKPDHLPQRTRSLTGARRGLLGATADGYEMYRTMGWQVQSPLVSGVIVGE